MLVKNGDESHSRIRKRSPKKQTKALQQNWLIGDGKFMGVSMRSSFGAHLDHILFSTWKQRQGQMWWATKLEQKSGIPLKKNPDSFWKACRSVSICRRGTTVQSNLDFIDYQQWFITMVGGVFAFSS